jgi:hypothetical protein
VTPALRDALSEHAQAHLKALGINEPLTWSPPKECCAGTRLPGRDLDDIDLDVVRDLAGNGNTPGMIAETLHTSIEHVRCVLSTIDQPREQAPGWLHQHQAPELLTREFFQREYVENRKSLLDIHNEFGYGKTALARHAKRAGIQLRKSRGPIPIDRTWLDEQYTRRGRAFYDIAAELGVSGMTVILAARRHGIASRPAGVHSNPDYTAVHENLPTDVRKAVEGQLHGWLRLRRFRDVINHPSLNLAATAIDVETSTLVQQVHRLEHDIGTTLLDRATPTTPMRPTKRGAALLADLQRPDIAALIEKHGQAPRGKRQVDEKQAVTNP